MQETTNKKLKKIELTDAPPDITVLNENWDTIDEELQAATDHENDTNIHVTTANKANWNSKANGSHNHSAGNITSGTLGVSRGGTGRASHTSDYFLRGNGTSAVKLSSPSDVLNDIGAMAAVGAFKVTGHLGSFTDQNSLDAALNSIISDNYGGATTIIAQLSIDFDSKEAYTWAAATTVIAQGGYHGTQLLMGATGHFFRRCVSGVWGKWQRMCQFKITSTRWQDTAYFDMYLDGYPLMIIASVEYDSGTTNATNKTILLYPWSGWQYLIKTSSEYFEIGLRGNAFHFNHKLTTDVTLNMIEIYA